MILYILGGFLASSSSLGVVAYWTLHQGCRVTDEMRAKSILVMLPAAIPYQRAVVIRVCSRFGAEAYDIAVAKYLSWTVWERRDHSGDSHDVNHMA